MSTTTAARRPSPSPSNRLTFGSKISALGAKLSRTLSHTGDSASVYSGNGDGADAEEHDSVAPILYKGGAGGGGRGRGERGGGTRTSASASEATGCPKNCWEIRDKKVWWGVVCATLSICLPLAIYHLSPYLSAVRGCGTVRALGTDAIFPFIALLLLPAPMLQPRPACSCFFPIPRRMRTALCTHACVIRTHTICQPHGLDPLHGCGVIVIMDGGLDPVPMKS
ncbi:hypothetical protein CVT25_012544 [Psilocybe cyanescens]|uniref:Uncharacterized protein n=1 Tax=Psilocybe cyanescens TaxID=93625 RepID=A0A409X0Z6_PSICY|nr:hypothetical protein CVT25_012544 [Psilocybe cyanescens]